MIIDDVALHALQGLTLKKSKGGGAKKGRGITTMDATKINGARGGEGGATQMRNLLAASFQT